MSDWPHVETDLRRALLASGRSASVVDRTLAAIAPIFAALERARGKVEDELAWALVAMEADRTRRRAHHARLAS
jgi:hypothetical protein